MRRTLEAIFGLDVRSLAALRIGLALIVLADVWISYQDLDVFYSGDGALPLREMPIWTWGAPIPPSPASVHLFSDAIGYQAFLFYLRGFVALAMLFGWLTRFAVPLTWFLTISLHARNVWVIDGGDGVLRMMLFWCMFLPMGACWSVDSSGRAAPPKRVLSVGSVALILQFCVMYLFAGLQKSDDTWRKDGYAVYMALSVSHFTKPMGFLLLQSRELMSFLTFATLVQEIFVWMLLFIPWKTWFFRLVCVVSYVGFHIGLGLCMALGRFQPLCMVIWVVMIPTEFWDWLARRFGVAGLEPEAEPSGKPPAFTPLSGPASLLCGALTLLCLAWNFRAWQEPRRHRQADLELIAAQAVASRAAPDLPSAMTQILILQKLQDELAVPRPAGDGRIKTAVLDARDAVYAHVPEQALSVAYTLGLEQDWRLFAPYPGAVHGWFVVVGTLQDGRQVDLFRSGAPVDWDKPAFVSEMYPNSRWRKYMMNLIDAHSSLHYMRHQLARWFARDWNSRNAGDEQLATVEIWFNREVTQRDYQPHLRMKVRYCLLDCSTWESDLAEKWELP